ncbi:MAG: hypothetical protein IMX01_09735 [Limnochordaceae bacterium]|nr:hypothetical protein [Limnochordaceae bacterium]
MPYLRSWISVGVIKLYRSTDGRFYFRIGTGAFHRCNPLARFPRRLFPAQR